MQNNNDNRTTRPMWTSPEYEKAIAEAMESAAKAAKPPKQKRFKLPLPSISPRVAAWIIAAIIALGGLGWVAAKALAAIKKVPPRDTERMERGLGFDNGPIPRRPSPSCRGNRKLAATT
jgi:hypothetical protein